MDVSKLLYSTDNLDITEKIIKDDFLKMIELLATNKLIINPSKTQWYLLMILQ